MSYVQIISPLVLHADPVIAKHAVTKRYVDAKKTSANASWFTTGVLPVGRLPALSGDITSAQGSGVAVLADSGITAGTYPKVTIDSAGRISSGTTLVSGDIPSVPFAKVTTGKPTTAAGYGIANLVSVTGGTVTGPITSTATPSANLDAVTKGYVDSALTGIVSGTLAVGDIVRKPLPTAPSGFLRCNGGYVDKSAYADLFGVVGYSLLTKVNLDYTSYAAVGAGQPWRQQYDFNTTQSGDITGWTTGTALPIFITQSSVVVTKNRVYLIGGYQEGTGQSAAVYTATINSDGTLGTWSITGSNLPSAVIVSQAVATKNRVYLLGGRTGAYTINKTYTAPINSDGTLGAWTTGTSLLSNLEDSQAFITKSRVYLLGGYTGSAYTSQICTATINSDGTLGVWSDYGSLPNAFGGNTQLMVTRNRLYLHGTVEANSTAVMFTAIINPDGTLGTWTTGTPLPVPVINSHSVVSRNRVYLLGGRTLGGESSTVYTAPINTDGTLGAWSTGTSLPGTITLSQTFATGSKLYLLSGFVNNQSSRTVFTASFSGGLNDYSKFYDGSINKFDGSDVSGEIIVQDQTDMGYTQPGNGQPWRQQYDINTTQSGDITGWTITTSLPATLYCFQILVTKNRIYTIGGGRGPGVTSSLSSVDTAPINSDGTLGTWVSDTALPTPVTQSQLIVTKNRIYLIGGNSGGSYISSVYTTTIDQDGTLGSWSTSTSSLPGALALSQAIVTKNRVYLLGGVVNGDTGVSTVYSTPINSDGTLGTWSIATSLPSAVAGSQAVVTKNRVYLIGGRGVTDGTPLSTVYTAPINSDGTLGTWSTSTPLPTGTHNSQVVVTKSRVYLLGGRVNDGYSSNVYIAAVNADGTLGGWLSSTSSLPSTPAYSQVAVTNSHIYIMGGYISGIHAAVFSGGLNDYTPYYDGTIVAAEPTQFKLPDFTAAETSGVNYYIKY